MPGFSLKVADIFSWPKQKSSPYLFSDNELRSEDRNNLTIAEAEALADGHSFELIDGRMVFKTADRQHSRSQSELTVKLYLEKGGRVVWLIFPIEKRVTIVTPAEWRWESNTLACPELLPGFSIQVAEIFSGLERKSSQSKKASAKAKTIKRQIG